MLDRILRVFSFVGTCQTVFQSDCTILDFPQHYGQVPVASRSRQHWGSPGSRFWPCEEMGEGILLF